MINNKYVVGISCIGSGVGQSVINSCRLSRLPLYTLGLGTNPFAYGAYDCDIFDYTPSIYDTNFIDELIQVCLKHKVDLLIPGLDDEVQIYAQNKEKFCQVGIQILVAGEQLIKLCRDKELMSKQLNPVVDAFVSTYTKKDLEYLSSIRKEIPFPLIAKPRSGNASRGIKIVHNFKDLDDISEDQIIQELAMPSRQDTNFEFYVEKLKKNQNAQVSEVSVQVVLDTQGNLLGRMASYNKLSNGVPIEIVPLDHPDIWTVVNKLLPKLIELGLVGPINIQGRITDRGFKIFEMNPRFTGITGLRALMGFNEVEICIVKWLNISSNALKLELNPKKFGVRQTADKSIPLERNSLVKDLYYNLNSVKSEPEKTLLITGSTGYLGQNLVNQLKVSGKYKIYTLNRNNAKAVKMFGDENILHYSLQDLESGKLSLGNVDIVIHLAFARPHCTFREISESLSWTNHLFNQLGLHQVPALINISSQSVYGQDNEPLWTEMTPVAPNTPYAQAKYATELMAASFHAMNNQVRTCSLRLTSLTGGKPGFIPVDVIGKFVNQSLNGQDIYIIGGKQILERLDIRDAVRALVALIQTDPLEWEPVYNIGSIHQHNILDIANLVVDRVWLKTGKAKIKISLEKKDIIMKYGMDYSKFSNLTGWVPIYDLADTIDSLIDFQLL